MKIKIPIRLLSRLTEEHRLECEGVFLKYEEFAEKNMYFFDEYTDHSSKHVEFVLETTNKLIPEQTLELLNSTDIFVLILSVLHHDLGMHINFDSLKFLYKENPVNVFTGQHFQTLWNDFVKEENKKDEGLKIESLLDLEKLSFESYDVHKGVASKFIRIHHPFLANIIATNGFPGKSGFINYNEKRHSYLYELVGLVAHSHGTDLRQVMDYLKRKYGELWKTPFGCRAVYLMTLVRIADYLHITDDRIDRYRLLLSEFRSESSEKEFFKHQSVFHSQIIYDNPETIYVYSEPRNFEVYIEMDQLIDNIQNELDHSWAVLGEVYGSIEMKLTIRRITSNLKNTEWIEASKFVGQRLKFNFDIRLIGLLIEPLYGENPSYGIRELIQNSTDACKTRRAIEKNEYEAEVKITISREQFIIEDNGIGMDINVIKNYFLKIGASFAESREWNRLNEDKNFKESSILRNGKFGIGILSSFLIGDKIKVETRKLGSEHIFSFETNKYDQVISITKNRTKGEFIGTKIIIPLKCELDPSIIVNWYRLDDIRVLLNDEVLKNKIKNDEYGKWNILECGGGYDLEEIKWSYDYKIDPFRLKGKNESVTYMPNLICNGIVIPERYDKKVESYIISKWPTIVLKGPTSMIDLDLSRNELNSNLPFLSELEKQLLVSYIDKLKSVFKNGDDKQINICDSKVTSDFRVTNFKDQKLIFTKNGYGLFNSFFMQRNALKRVVRIWVKKGVNLRVLKECDSETAYILEGTGGHPYLKNKIVAFRDGYEICENAKIYMPILDYEDYQNWSANIYKLGKNFINNNVIHRFDLSQENYIREKFQLDIDTAEVVLAIEYNFNNSKKDSSFIFEEYFKNEAIMPFYNI